MDLVKRAVDAQNLVAPLVLCITGLSFNLRILI